MRCICRPNWFPNEDLCDEMFYYLKYRGWATRRRSKYWEIWEVTPEGLAVLDWEKEVREFEAWRDNTPRSGKPACIC